MRIGRSRTISRASDGSASLIPVPEGKTRTSSSGNLHDSPSKPTHKNNHSADAKIPPYSSPTVRTRRVHLRTNSVVSPATVMMETSMLGREAGLPTMMSSPKAEVSPTSNFGNTVVGDIIFSGWLTKRGGSKGGRKNWKLRWFVLRRDTLSYYKLRNGGEDLKSLSIDEAEPEVEDLDLLDVVQLSANSKLIDFVDPEDEKVEISDELGPIEVSTLGRKKKGKEKEKDNGRNVIMIRRPVSKAGVGTGGGLFSVLKATKSARQFLFQVESEDRVVLLKAVDQKQKEEWLKILQEIFGKLKRKDSGKHAKMHLSPLDPSFKWTKKDEFEEKGVTSPMAKHLERLANFPATPSTELSNQSPVPAAPEFSNLKPQGGVTNKQFPVKSTDSSSNIPFSPTNADLFGPSSFEASATVTSNMKSPLGDTTTTNDLLFSPVSNVPSPVITTIANVAGEPREILSEWEIPYKFLHFEKKVGEGMFGEVYKGKLWDTPVALKTLKIVKKTKDILQELKHEVIILSRLRHPNVILYIGASTKLPDACIVTEWCDRGSLSDLLYSKSIIDFPLMMHIAIGVAQGMNYLHSLEPQIIHRDLKSGNVLLDKNFTAKVCDFGLSFNTKSTGGDNKGKHGILGTPEWMAPEVMDDQSYNYKVDVYSFGIVLCEIFSRIKPYSDQFKIESFIDAVDYVLDGGAQPTIPKWCGPQIRDLILRCLKRDPSDRPSFSTIVTTLRAIYDGVPSESIFSSYEAPRIMEMLFSRNETFQEIACRDIAELQLRSKLKVDCQRCGFNPGESELLNHFTNEDMSMVIVRISTAFSSKEESLISQSTRAFAEILSSANKQRISQCRTVLRENGGLKRILVFLNSANADIKQNASKIMLYLTNDLDSEEQVKFVDLSYAGLSALAALSGGYRGLDRLKNVVEEEVKQLIQKREDLDALISKKSQFTAQLAAAEETMRTKFETESASTLRRGTLHIKSRNSTHLSFGNSGKMADDIKQALSMVKNSQDDLAPSSSIDFDDDHESAEIPLVSSIPETFLEYFGDFKRTHHCYGVCWDSVKERWDLRYFFLYGDELRIFVTHESEPDDPINLLYLGSDSNVPAIATPTELFGNRNCLEVKVSRTLFRFGFRTKRDSYIWANLLDPDANPPPPEPSKSKKSEKESSLGSKLSNTSPTSLEEALSVAKSLISVPELPIEFQEYNEGMDVLMHGYLAVNDVISGHWVSRYCVLVNGVLRVFGTHCDPPDDCQMILYVSGPMASSQFEIAIPKDPTGPWGTQSFAMQDDAGIYMVCTKTAMERDRWVATISP